MAFGARIQAGFAALDSAQLLLRNVPVKPGRVPVECVECTEHQGGQDGLENNLKINLKKKDLY
jgi:hypothetical protein